MNSIEIGKLITQQGGFQAFVPNPFPPKDGFEFSPAILKKDSQATRLLGKLDGITAYFGVKKPPFRSKPAGLSE